MAEKLSRLGRKALETIKNDRYLELLAANRAHQEAVETTGESSGETDEALKRFRFASQREEAASELLNKQS